MVIVSSSLKGISCGTKKVEKVGFLSNKKGGLDLSALTLPVIIPNKEDFPRPLRPIKPICSPLLTIKAALLKYTL